MYLDGKLKAINFLGIQSIRQHGTPSFVVCRIPIIATRKPKAGRPNSRSGSPPTVIQACVSSVYGRARELILLCS